MLAFMSPPIPTLPAPVPVVPRSLKRPRGLWKQRRLESVQAPTSPWPLKETVSHDSRAFRLSSGSLSPRPSHSPSPTLVQLRSPSASSHRSLTPTRDEDCDDHDDQDDARSVSSTSSKRRRISGHFAPASELTPSPASGFAHACESITYPSLFPSHAIPPPVCRDSPAPALPMSPQLISRSVSDATSASNISSISAKARHRQLSLQSPQRSADFEDWENLKELFARAADRYDADEFPEAVPLLRAVIRECHRFLIDHPDPSVVYADPRPNRSSRSPEAITPTEERLHRDWDSDMDAPSVASWSSRRRTSMAVTASRHTELPTAFHAIFGTSLFLMGNLVSQDPSIVLSGEPDAPSTYWLAALDVFETGENLPSRIGGTGLDTTEDWRMAIVWGRTLVCLADEKVTHNMKVAKEQAQASSAASGGFCYYPMGSAFPMSEPHWPPSSPFHAIAQFRPPVTRRMSLYSASAHDIMVLAMDQFSRGIFHMPHPHYSHTHNPSFLHTPGTTASPCQSSHYFSSASAPPSHYASPYVPSSDPLVSFSRPKELFTIASEVLGVAERLVSGAHRHYWASWADSVFNQMKNEADMDAWRAPILSARGRCWLVMGSAPVEEMEAALEAGDLEVLHTPEAEEAREGLAMAISFFERAKAQAADGHGYGYGYGTTVAGDDVSPLLAEALLVLANLTADENKREELYTRAQAEAGEDLKLDPVVPVDGSEGCDADEAMDTSM